MRIFKFAVISLALIVISGCANTIDTTHLNTFHDVRPTSILAVPPVNNATDVQATTSVLATLPYFLGEKGFYVFPVNTVKYLLEHEGYYEAAEIHAAPTENLASLFNADAVLYVTINEWTSKYIVFATRTDVDFSYRLVGADGTLIWEEQIKTSYSPNNNSGGIVGLIANAISAAIERAAPNYIPLTRQAHAMALISPMEVFKYTDSMMYSMSKKPEAEEDFGIPPGPYHPEYEAYYKRVNGNGSEKSVAQ